MCVFAGKVPSAVITLKTGDPCQGESVLGLIFPARGPWRTFGNHWPMTTIRVKDNEPFDVALRRFKRTIEKLGLLNELRAREFYEKPTAERKRKKAAAVKRHLKRVRSQQLPQRLY